MGQPPRTGDQFVLPIAEMILLVFTTVSYPANHPQFVTVKGPQWSTLRKWEVPRSWPPPLLPSTHECFRDPELRLGPGALGRPASFPSSGVRFSPLKDATRDQISGLWTL